jgi:hypothetical protein
MKHALLSFCLTAVAVSALTTVHFTRASSLEGNIPMGTAIPSTLNCIRSIEIVVVPSDEHEIHAVVVDMPQRPSLSHASPETWDSLPMSDPPCEQSPATTVLQVAMN